MEDSLAKDLHFVLFPLMAQGHLIPMMDIARLLARRGATVTVITTPLNANRLKPSVARAVVAKLQIQLLQVPFPSTEAGLPEGCENLDMLPSAEHTKFFLATKMLLEPVLELFQELRPVPSCILSDMCFPWTMDVANRYDIPRLTFNGFGYFSSFCLNSLWRSGILDDMTSELEKFVVPGLPHRVELTKAKFTEMLSVNSTEKTEFVKKINEAAASTFGHVINSFQELEPEYAKEFMKLIGKNVWSIGPVSLSNKNNLDKAERGNKAAIDQKDCLKWLDSWEPSSVLYVCLGSLSLSSTAQMVELGLALELSAQPFIWSVRQKSKELERWFTDGGFEERVKDRGLVVHGWVPQVLILSHQAIGGFLTHCGWNSTLEGISAGVPLLTWPHFDEQFLNESLVVQVLKIGVRSGVEVPVFPGQEEEMGLLVKKDEIKMAVDALMDGGVEGEERRKRARELGNMAKRAMDEGGSSHLGMTLLIQSILEQANNKKSS